MTIHERLTEYFKDINEAPTPEAIDEIIEGHEIYTQERLEHVLEGIAQELGYE